MRVLRAKPGLGIPACYIGLEFDDRPAMSRFNNPKALPGLLPRPDVSPAIAAPALPRSFAHEGFRPVAPPSNRVFTLGYGERPNTAQTLCFFLVSAYLLSGAANDIIFHFLQAKAYISAACVILLPILFLGTGAYLRAFETPTARWFVAFVVWLAIAAPFSVWRGGSATMLFNYVPRSFMVCFYLVACLVTLRQIRTVVRVIGICALFVIVSCATFGGWVDGRFSIPDSLFYSNANGLALQLLLGIIFLMYPFFEASKFAKFVSVVAIFLSLHYMLKTGSRGVIIATLATGFVVFLLSRQRIAVVVLGVPALVMAFALAPAEMRHRVTLILIDPMSASAEDASAVGSQMQREKLLKTSIYLAFTNPLFGVGPGEFAVKVAGDEEKKGEHSAWLGTHNSYTQVASEAGLPAFIFYCATIVTCMRMNYRLYKRSKDRPGMGTITGISFCMFLGFFAYSIATFFFHEAYGPQLPLMAGVSIALYLTVKPALDGYEKNATRLPGAV
jgi:O-antigen ligase